MVTRTSATERDYRRKAKAIVDGFRSESREYSARALVRWAKTKDKLARKSEPA